jgi:hypothetical protein
MVMATDQHLDEEASEKYSLGQMSARGTAEVEKHLLICEPCRQSVASSDAYVAAMRAAATELRKAERKPTNRKTAAK